MSAWIIITVIVASVVLIVGGIIWYKVFNKEVKRRRARLKSLEKIQKLKPRHVRRRIDTFYALSEKARNATLKLRYTQKANKAETEAMQDASDIADIEGGNTILQERDQILQEKERATRERDDALNKLEGIVRILMEAKRKITSLDTTIAAPGPLDLNAVRRELTIIGNKVQVIINNIVPPVPFLPPSPP